MALLAVLAVLAVLAARAAAAPAGGGDGRMLEDAAGDHQDDADLVAYDDCEAKVPLASADGTSTATARAPGAASGGPAVRDVIAAALRAAGLAGDPAAGWRRRARLAALVPQLSLRVGQDDTWKEIADPTLGHAVTYGISASWRLERLVYEPSELRIASVDVLRRRERRRLAWYVISLYRSWRRTQNEDVAAQLDVVTDGWFSQWLANHAESRPLPAHEP